MVDLLVAAADAIPHERADRAGADRPSGMVIFAAPLPEVELVTGSTTGDPASLHATRAISRRPLTWPRGGRSRPADNTAIPMFAQPA
jgi:hypothetical protein